MKKLDVLGFKLNKAQDILTKEGLEVEKIYTEGTNKKFLEDLSEERVLKVEFRGKKAILTVGKF